jgi:transposase
VGYHTEAFIGVDTAKLRNAVAVAESGLNGQVYFFGEIDNTEAAMRKLIKKLESKYKKLNFCYEAGPTGYGLFHLIEELGHNCSVVAPSLVPRKPGDRVKTNRRDALNLAKLLRAGQLVAVWVPDERHEAMRDLVRAREAAHLDYKRNRQQVSSFLLRLGRYYPGKKKWGRAHLKWLATQKLDHYEQRIAFEELLLAVRQSRERIERLEQAIRDSVPEWSLAPVVEALRALRGIDLISAVVFMSEIGDLSRFETPRQLMAFIGLVPSERSTGDSIIRGRITKSGNRRARRILVEAAWSYRHPPRVSKEKQKKIEAVPRTVREIAWKAQTRLCGRFRKLTRRGKLSTIATTAVARELAAFIWAINRELATKPCGEQKSQPRPHQVCRRAQLSQGQALAGSRRTAASLPCARRPGK